MKDVAITFYLNGKRTSAQVDPLQRTVDFLRSDLFLTGTKEGCGDGDCGACTVALGTWEGAKFIYRAVASCLLPVAKLQGKSLVTVEGLAQQNALHCIQEAIVDTHGAQCGFCSPGFIMSFFALFAMKPIPTLNDVEIALQGNICRCTGYEGIRKAAEKMIGYQGKASFIPASIRSCESEVQGLSQKIESPQYITPTTVKELLDVMQQRPDAILVSGLTDLAVAFHTKGVEPSSIIDLSLLEEANQIRADEQELHLGAGIPIEVVINDPIALGWLPALGDLEFRMASKQIRNIATLGGNIANASPIGDSQVLLAAAGAEIVSVDPRGIVHTRPISSLYVGYKQTQLAKQEVILEIVVPRIPKGGSLAFKKSGKRSAVDIATVNSASMMVVESGRIKTWRICFGGIGPTIEVLDLLEKTIASDTDVTTIQENAKEWISKMTPISDIRGSAEYRLQLVIGHIVSHFLVQTGKEEAV